MNRNVLLIAKYTIIAFYLFSSANLAVARDFNRQAKSGKTSFLIYHHSVSRNCDTIPIEINFVKYPKHGTATAKLKRRAYSAKYSAPDHCYGSTGLFIEIYYKSDKGYKGSDSIVYRRVSQNINDRYNKQIHRIKIHVK